MKCARCGQEIMEGAAFCPYCGGKVSGERPGDDRPVYQADVKGKLKSGRLAVYRDRTEFVTSSVQKTIYNYSALVAVRKRQGVGSVLGLGLDHIDFITEDGNTESCPVNRKDVHEAFLRIQEAVNPYLAQRKERLLAQGIRYSLLSGMGLGGGGGILNISDDRAELRTKSGQNKTVLFQEVKSVNLVSGSLEFSLTDGSSKSFGIDKELQNEVLTFVKEAVEPYIAQRKEALREQGIYFSSLSSCGSEVGTLNILVDRAEFISRETITVPYRDIRTASLYGEMLELALTDGTSKSFRVEKDIQTEVLSFIKEAIQPYVLKRTVGFDTSFGIDQRIEVNEERGVFHILRQGGSEITEERPLSDLIQCEQTECVAPKSALGLLAGAAKAVGVQDKLGAPDAENIISYMGVVLTLRGDQGAQLVRFGDFPYGMSRTHKKYDQYLVETARFMEYLAQSCPECEWIALPEPEPEVEPAGSEENPSDGANPEETVNDREETVNDREETSRTAPPEKDHLGIKKYIEGVSNFIDSCSTPMTIAVQGSQRSGKNSIMRLLSNTLKERYSDGQIWLDARLLSQSNSEEPLSSVVGKELIRQISGAENGASKDSAKKIAKGVIELVASAIAPESSAGQNLVEGLFNDGPAISPEKLLEAFSKLAEKRAGGPDGKVIILINELDKLAPGKAVELLDALRYFFDCEGCVFVTAIDYSLFQRGVRENPDMDLDENQEKVLFDEIFQMSFRVPASGYDIQNYVKGKLEHMGICTDSGTELDFYTALIRNSVGVEPKSIDRLFNSFLLIKGMEGAELYESRVQRLMLFALLCMQARFYAAYNRLKGMKDRVTPELLSGLAGEGSEIAACSGQSEEDRAKFRAFARVFCDIINTDSTAGISQSECAVFTKVLEFSIITSK